MFRFQTIKRLHHVYVRDKLFIDLYRQLGMELEEKKQDISLEEKNQDVSLEDELSNDSKNTILD